MKISEVIDEYRSDIDEVNSWIENRYQEIFGPTFNGLRQLRSDVDQITDDELEYVLTGLPLDLIVVSEKLNELRSVLSVLKIRQKELRQTYYEEYQLQHTQSEASAYADHMVVDHKIAASAYENLIKRVESDISLSKELIMGCKKIWDARRSNEKSVVDEIVPESVKLPNYTDLQDIEDSNIQF